MGIAVTDQSFEQEVLKADLPVLVDFWAPWCGPCRMLAPILEELGKTFKGSLKIAQVNIDEEPEQASRYGVLSIPTLMLFKGGEVLDTKVGLQAQAALEAWIREKIA